MKPTETRAEHRCYNNLVGLIFLHAITRGYSIYASECGEDLEDDEEHFLKLLYAKKGNSIVSGLCTEQH